jgi:hypothetical protein
LAKKNKKSQQIFCTVRSFVAVERLANCVIWLSHECGLCGVVIMVRSTVSKVIIIIIIIVFLFSFGGSVSNREPVNLGRSAARMRGGRVKSQGSPRIKRRPP